MRELLTGLAIVLIVALTTALVAPYFIDWNGQRTFIEARLSEVLGQKVTIGGKIDVKLLPTPYLVLGQTVIGSDEGPVRLSIHHLDLELSVTPLLHGEFDVTQARLVEPTVRLTLAADRTLPALPDAPAFHADVSLDHIAVTGGTLAIADPTSGRTLVLDNIDLEADAASLAGPFKGAGTEGSEDMPTSFRFSTSAAQGGRARTRLVVAKNAAHAGLDLDGTVALSSAGRDTIHQSFEGKVTVTGRLDERDGAPVAWTLNGPLTADPQSATLAAGELRLGDEDRGLTLAASATADLAEHPHLDIDLSAKTLDLDRMSGPAVDGHPAAPPQLPRLATLRRALGAALPPLPATVVAKIDTATWAGDTLADLSARFGVGGPGAQPFSLAGHGQGGARLAIDGTLSAERFAGKVVYAAQNLPGTLRWLAAIGAPLPIRARDVPAGAVSGSAQVDVAEDAVTAQALDTTIGRSRFAGTARLDLARSPPLFAARLTTPALKVDALPDLGAWRRSTHALDLDLHLAAKHLDVAEAGPGKLATGPISLALTRSGRHIALTSLRAEDVGGATIAAEGELSPQAAHLALRLDAARLEAAARLLRQVAPGDVAEALADRAPTLSPASIRLDADWSATPQGALTPSRGTLDGSLGASTLHVAVAPDSQTQGALSVDASLAAASGSALLRQLGGPAPAADALGRGRVTLAAHGQPDRPMDTKLTADIGGTHVEVTGGFKLLAAPRGGSGSADLRSSDLSPILQAFGMAAPAPAEPLAAEGTATIAYGMAGLALTDLKAKVGDKRATGTLRISHDAAETAAVTGALDLDHLALGRVLGLALGPDQPAAPGSWWSNRPFAPGLADPPRTALDLTAKSLSVAPGLTATDAKLDLTIEPALVRLRQVEADVAGGHVHGSLSLRRDGLQAGLEGTLTTDNVGVDLPALGGRLAGKLDFAGGGGSAFALVTSLAGSGSATITDLTIPQADPAALTIIFDDVERDDLAVDADTVARTYGEAAHASLGAGTRRFDLAMAGGTLSATPEAAPDAPAGPVASSIDLSLDLRQPSLATQAKETLVTLPKGWTGAPPSLVVAWSGALRQPRRSIDVSSFINAVAARALARESARIEAYELDVRERALFDARLQSERRRAQDKAKAEADAREAEAAARLAKARKEAAAKAAKAAQEKAAQAKADQDRAADERAARDRATEKARTPPDGAPAPPTGAQPQDERDGADPSSPRPRFTPAAPDAPGDPSAAGRY